MKGKFFSFLLLSFSLICFSGCVNKSSKNNIVEKIQNTNQIVWGVKNDARLFGLMDVSSREIKGFDIDIAKAITEKILGRDGNAVFVEVTSKTRTPLLKNNNIDAIIATMTITEDRKKQVSFSDPYFNAGQSLLVKNTSPIHGLEDLTSDKTILVVKGSTSAINIRNMAPKAKILELENYAEAFIALKADQGDAMTTDSAILLGILNENPNYKLVGKRFTKEPYGIAVKKDQDKFLFLINKALKEIYDDGIYDKIHYKWFSNQTKGNISK